MILYNIKYFREQINLQFPFSWYGVKWSKNVQSIHILVFIEDFFIKYCEKVYERSGKNLFWSIKNAGEILDKLKARDFNATSLSTYDFSTLYTTLPHNSIKDKLIDLIERTFQKEGSP